MDLTFVRDMKPVTNSGPMCMRINVARTVFGNIIDRRHALIGAFVELIVVLGLTNTPLYSVDDVMLHITVGLVLTPTSLNHMDIRLHFHCSQFQNPACLKTAIIDLTFINIGIHSILHLISFHRVHKQTYMKLIRTQHTCRQNAK